MRNALAELARLIRQLRIAIPWSSQRLAYVWMSLAAVLFAWGMGVSFAGSLWSISPDYRFNAVALLPLLVPAVTGFFLTYLFDLLEIGLGWRVIEVVFLALFCSGTAAFASQGRFGFVAGLLVALSIWVVAVRCASDLVDFRPDKLKVGYSDQNGLLSHTGLHKLLRNLFFISACFSLITGFVVRMQQYVAPWWVVVLTGAGAALAATAGLVIYGYNRAAVEMRTWESDEVVIWPNVTQERRQATWKLAALAAAVGLLFPANLSPISRLSPNRLFLNLNSIVGPYFVNSRSTRPSSSSSFGDQLIARLGMADSLQPNNVTQIITLLVMVIVALYVLKRLLPLLRGSKAETPVSYSGDWGFWRWLIQGIRALIGAIRGFYQTATGWLLKSEAAEKAAQRLHVGALRQRRRAPSEPQALVRYLYARYLAVGASRGRRREIVETAAEYQLRLAQELRSEEIEAVTDLTSMYQRVRYGQELADVAFATAVKRYWAAAIKALRSLGR